MTTSSQSEASTSKVLQFDPAHTIVEFVAKHMLITTVRGRFKSMRGSLLFDEANPANSSIEVEIDAASLDSGVEYRDNHLKSPDFFEAEKYPTITFKSTRVVPEGGDRAKIHGDLTIRDTTREVVLDAEIMGRAMNPMKKQVVAFEAKATINRKDFGLNWNMALETGGWLVADTVKIEISAEAFE